MKNQIQTNQPFTTYDVAESLHEEEGTFLVQRAGQSAFVQAEQGHSIRSWTPVGSIEPSVVVPGSNPPYTVTRVDELVHGNSNRSQERNR